MKRFAFFLALAVVVLAASSNGLADTLMFDFGESLVEPGESTNSPLHANGGLSVSEDTWNHLNGGAVPGSLLFADGSAATGVAVDLGFGVGNTTIDLTNEPTRSGVGSRFNDGVSDVGTAGIDNIWAEDHDSVSKPLGVQITGLSAGTYEVYAMGRNMNTNKVYSMIAHAGAGAVGNYDYAAGGFDSMTVNWPGDPAGTASDATASWIEGHLPGGTANINENYMKMFVTLESGEALNFAIENGGETIEVRGFLNLLQVTEVSGPIPVLRVNRLTGVMTLENAPEAGSPQSIRGYSISSELGALDQANWQTIAGNFDDAAGTGDGSVDSDDAWTVLTAPGATDNLSEFQFAGTPGDAGSLAVGQTVNLNSGVTGPWLPSNNESDLFVELSLADGSIVVPQIVYEGNGGESLSVIDLNHDGNVDVNDYAVFDMFNQTDMTGLSSAQAHLRGDLDGDLDSDISDYLIFYNEYEALLGPGAFAAMTLSVPEPSSLLLLASFLMGAMVLSGRRLGWCVIPVRAKSLSCMAAVAIAVSISTSTASAVTLMLDFGPDAISADPAQAPFPEHLVNSPLHQVGGFSQSETTWNTVGTVNEAITDITAGPGSGLKFSDGTDAPLIGINYGSFVGEVLGTIGDTGIALGQIALGTNPDRSINFSGGNTGPGDGIFAAGAAGRDAIFNGTANGALGLQVTGLPAGTYDVYVMGRNRNTSNTHDINAYAGAGANGVDFDFAGYDSQAVSWTSGSVTNWVEGHESGEDANANENFSKLLVTVEAGQALNVGVDSGPDDSETRAFLSLLQITPHISPLSMLVDPVSGEIALSNPASNGTTSISLNSYQLTSTQGSLKPGPGPNTWFSLDDATPGSGDDGNSWNESDGSSAFSLAETFLSGSSTINAGNMISLGQAYDTSIIDEDMVFEYIDFSSGLLVTGLVEFTTISTTILQGDFNNDGIVNIADYTVWRDNLGAASESALNGNGSNNGSIGPEDYALWKMNFGTTSGSLASIVTNVPEPRSAMLLAIAFASVFGLRFRSRLLLAPVRVGTLLLALCFASSASAVITPDGEYQFGDLVDEFSIELVGDGEALSTTYETNDVSGASDLNLASGDPTYVDLNMSPYSSGKPVEVGQWGADFDGDGDSIQRAETSHLTLLGDGSTGVSMWAYPRGSANRQVLYFNGVNVVGVAITPSGKWAQIVSDHTNNSDIVAADNVVNDTWTHIMQHSYITGSDGAPSVRPGSGTGGSSITVLYINGEPVSAHIENIIPVTGAPLLMGAETPATVQNSFNGVIGHADVYSSSDFNLFEDNVSLVSQIASISSNAITDGNVAVGDVNIDGVVDGDDVTAFLAGWFSKNRIDGFHGDLYVGGLSTWQQGDVNLDGRVTLADAGLLNQALAPFGGLDFSLLTAGNNVVPEPTTIGLISLAGIALLLKRRK